MAREIKKSKVTLADIHINDDYLPALHNLLIRQANKK